MTPGHVRCPRCNCLVAQRLPGGALEIRSGGGLVAIVREGVVACPRCSIVVAEIDVELRLSAPAGSPADGSSG